jgi:hypothetical protein
MIPGSNQIHSLATKYSKPQLQQMAQMGEISPLDAVMAGMMIDRVVLSANKPPESTVADDVFAPKTQMAGVAPGNGAPGNGAQEAPGGARQEIAARMHMPQLAQAPQSTAAISAANGGLMSIPRPGEKYNQDNFATGGIVAFDEGGRVKKEYLTRDPIDAELAEFQAEAEQARGANTRPIFEQQNYRMNQGPSGGLPQIMSSPEAAAAPAVAAPLAVVKAREKIGETKPAPVGPLSAMAQKAAPASDEFAQQGANLMKLPTRTPTNTTGLIDTPEEIAKDREDILNSTIGYAGAEIMAGKSQFAMTNIGEGLSKAFASYAQRIGEHKKMRKSDVKDFATIAQADEALKAGDVKAALNAWTHLNDTKERAKVEREKMLSEEKQERIRAGANTSPFEAWLKGTPEQRAEIEKFASIGKNPTEKTPQEVRGLALTTLSKNDEYAMLSSSKKPEDRALAATMLKDAESYIRGTDTGAGGGETDKYSGAKEQRYQTWLKSQQGK